MSSDGGIGYKDPVRLKADRPTVLDIGGVQIEVAGHGIGNGELENVRRALEKVPPHRLRGLQRIEFVDHELRGPRTGRLANARYVRDEEGVRVLLSRAGARDWSERAVDRLNRDLAERTILHETAHHVWAEETRARRRRVLEAGFAEALRRQGVGTRGQPLEEVFAVQASRYLHAPDVYRDDLPCLADFFDRLYNDHDGR